MGLVCSLLRAQDRDLITDDRQIQIEMEKIQFNSLTKGGVTGPANPKIQALPEWGRGGLTIAWIFVKDLSICTEGPQR